MACRGVDFSLSGDPKSNCRWDSMTVGVGGWGGYGFFGKCSTGTVASAIIVEDSWRGRGEEVIDRALGGPWLRPWAIYCNLTSLRTKTATVSSFAYSPSPYITRSVFLSPHPLLLKQLCSHVGWQMCFYLELNTEDFSGLIHLIIKKQTNKETETDNLLTHEQGSTSSTLTPTCWLIDSALFCCGV